MDGVAGGEAISGEAASKAPPERNPHPATVLLSENALPPPFLRKTYDMVEDPTTDAIISWSPANNSLIIWDWQELSRDLLPKYFKHNNFTSFVRQLNTYGFRKMDPDRWEFANEGFLRGQKHLLKTIKRKKSVHQEHGTSQSQGQGSSSSSLCVEVGKFGIEEEVEQLKRDKNVLMQELVKLRQNQQSTDNKLQVMVKRLQAMEHRQQQIMSFLAKAVHNPTFLSQFLQKQSETESNKKRRLREDAAAENRSSDASDHGQMVKYQPLRSLMNIDDLFLDEFSSPNRVLLGVTLQEVLPATSGHVASGRPSTSTSLPDTLMPAISRIPQESINEFPAENYMDTTEKNVSGEAFISPNPFLDGGSVPVQLDIGISQDLDIDELMSNCDMFEEYLAENPVVLGDATTTIV